MTPAEPPVAATLRRQAVLAVGLAGLATIGLGLLARPGLDPHAAGPGLAAALYLLVAAGVVAGIGGHRPHAAFGLANAVTLARAALVCALLGLVGAAPGDRLQWLALAIGFLALALDGLDGWIARRRGTVSRFGAAFDREIDGLSMLVVAVVVAALGRAGHFVLIAGALRYLFLGAQRLAPWLGAELPPSRRRKAAFGGSLSLLLVCLAPVLEPAVANAVAAAAVGLVAASFAVDVAWLFRTRTVATDA